MSRTWTWTMLRYATLRRRWSGRCGRPGVAVSTRSGRSGRAVNVRGGELADQPAAEPRASRRPSSRVRRRARFGDDPQVGPGGDAGPRQFGGGTAHDDIEAVAQSTDPFDPRCPPRLSPGSNCPPMTSRSGPTFSLPAEPGTDDASRLRGPSG